MTFTTSRTSTDVLTVGLAGTFSYEIGVSAITQTLTLDLVVDVVGTAHIILDPAPGGPSALGLAGAAAWLRRRRSLPTALGHVWEDRSYALRFTHTASPSTPRIIGRMGPTPLPHLKTAVTPLSASMVITVVRLASITA